MKDFTETYCDARGRGFYDQHLRIQYLSQQDPRGLRRGESIYFSCEEGYRLRGASSAKCLSSGDFERSGMLSYCQSKYFSRFNRISILQFNIVTKKVDLAGVC